jgi:trans-aconitate 2-methyltransferase
MATWDSSQYLKFANERTQPSIDLVARIALEAPARIIDLGCGPGNSTAVLARRWPQATITGLDSSPAMLATARKDHPQWSWRESGITEWAETNQEEFEVVFSNAALHWVPDHPALMPKLLGAVAPGGALAFQMPHSLRDPHQRLMRELAASAAWRGRFTRTPVTWHVEPAEFYYNVLAPHAAHVELWFTDYVFVFAGPEKIVEWHRGAALPPFLQALPDDAARAEFLRDYLAAITPHYPPQPDGKILQPFRRLFVIAYR